MLTELAQETPIRPGDEALKQVGQWLHDGSDVVVVIGLAGTRWAIHATRFTAAWGEESAPEEEFAQITLGRGALQGRSYALAMATPLHYEYVREKFGPKMTDRDAADLTRILSTLLHRDAYLPQNDVGEISLMAELELTSFAVRGAAGEVVSR